MYTSSFSGHFRQYDYGEDENLIHYRRTSPPDYELGKVTAPGYLIYSHDDFLADNVTDFPRLYNSLGNCLGKILTPSSFNHVDFICGRSAPKVAYSKVTRLFSQH